MSIDSQVHTVSSCIGRWIGSWGVGFFLDRERPLSLVYFFTLDSVCGNVVSASSSQSWKRYYSTLAQDRCQRYRQVLTRSWITTKMSSQNNHIFTNISQTLEKASMRAHCISPMRLLHTPNKLGRCPLSMTSKPTLPRTPHHPYHPHPPPPHPQTACVA